MASSSCDSTARLWDARTGQLRALLAGHAGGVRCLAFAPDSQTLATGDETLVRLWDTSTGALRATLKRDHNPVNSVAFSPDGRTLAAGGTPHWLVLWDLATHTVRAHCDLHHDGEVTNLAFTPDSKTLLSTALGDYDIHRWDCATGQPRKSSTALLALDRTCAFTADGRWLASPSKDGNVRLLDTSTGTVHAIIPARERPLHRVCFSPNGKTLAINNEPLSGLPLVVGLWDVGALTDADRRGDCRNGHELTGNLLDPMTTPFFLTNAGKFDTGGVPHSVAVADLNGDGKLDLAVANYGTDNVGVLLGNGDDVFQTPKSYDTGKGPASIAVADVNGDGSLDLVVANYVGNNMSVLLGIGDGTFQHQQTFATSGRPASVAVADVNGDGRLDLVVANYVSDNVSMLLGKGNGTFQHQQTFATGSKPISVAAADVNGDDRLDLIVANHGSDYVSVLLEKR